MNPLHRRLAGQCLVVLGTAVLAAPADAGEDASLPPVDCVRGLRAARIAHLRGDAALELETLRVAAERFPDEIAPVYALLEYHRQHGLSAEEHRELYGSLATRLEDPRRSLPTGVLARIARDPEAAPETLRLFEEHVRRRVDGPEASKVELLNLLATLQARLGMEEQTADTLERLLRLDPSEPVAWTLYELSTGLERWERAAVILASLIDEDKLADLRGTYIRVLGRAGLVEEQRRQVDLYVADQTVVHPLRLDLLSQAAWDLRDAGEDAEAERLFRKKLELDPENEGAKKVLLHLYGSEEERRRLADAEARRWREESDPQTLFREGTQRLTAGDAEAAIELLRRAAPDLPNLEPAWYNLGMAAYRLQDWETVVSAFGRAAELNPERAETVFFRGIGLAQLERCAESIAALERALELDPERALAHYYLASCHRALGDAEAYRRHRQLYDAAQGS